MMKSLSACYTHLHTVSIPFCELFSMFEGHKNIFAAYVMENYQTGAEAKAATGHSCQQKQQQLKKNINVANKSEWKREREKDRGRKREGDRTRGKISLVMHLTHEKLWPRYK